MRLTNDARAPRSLAPAADLLANAVRQLSAQHDQVSAALEACASEPQRAELQRKVRRLSRLIASCNDLVTVASHPCATLILIEDRLREKQATAQAQAEMN